MVYITDKQTNEELVKLFKSKKHDKNMTRIIQGKIKGLVPNQFKKKEIMMAEEETKPEEEKSDEE